MKLKRILPFPHIECAGLNCVILGRSGKAYFHPANIDFNRAVMEITERIEPKVTYITKADVSNLICSTIIKECCAERKLIFTKWNKERFWYEKIKDETILARIVKHAIRYHRRKRQRNLVNIESRQRHLKEQLERPASIC